MILVTVVNLPHCYQSRCVMCTELMFVGKGISFLRSDLESIASELLSLQQVMVLHYNFPGSIFSIIVKNRRHIILIVLADSSL